MVQFPTSLSTKHEYYTQIQLQLHVWNLEESQFIIWTPNWFTLENITKDNSFVSAMTEQCHMFFYRNIVPKLMQKPQNILTGASPEIYCICKKPQDDRKYVGCDNGACNMKWFHLDCVGIKRVPKGTWYCPVCCAEQ